MMAFTAPGGPVRRTGASVDRLDRDRPDGRHYRETTTREGAANVAKVTMPQLGESVAEGTIGKWLKQPGDHVDKYEPLLEVITDKVNAEVPSPFEGVLKEILAEEGATVPNNAEIAIIETADDGSSNGASAPTEATAAARAEAKTEAPAAAAPAPDPPAPEPAIAKGPAGSDESLPSSPPPVERPAAAATAAAPSAAAPSAAAPSRAAHGDPDARMTPAVRRLLREHGLSAEQIVGTGGGGRITRDDVLAVVEAIRTGGTVPAPTAAPSDGTSAPARPATSAPSAAPAPPAAPASADRRPVGALVSFPDGADEVLLPMTQMRKGIATQMTRALQAPHAYVQMEVDATRLVAARERSKKAYQAKEGISLSFVPFVVKAAAEALKRNPTFNAHWTDDGLLAKRRVNIGVAVAVDDGLIVPVIRDADTLSIHGLNVAITDVANRARLNKLRVDDFGGGTFTVDNTGYLGTNLVMPILNVPEVGIVTMEAITKRPVVQSTAEGDVIAIRPVMNMVLGVDHRANDGAGGAALLRDIKAWLEAVGPDTPIY
jgi:2-oxoisovalerate dehydrogenase E2 component (dihydrolipoyl transacylase)